jgi:hypothetical protein
MVFSPRLLWATLGALLLAPGKETVEGSEFLFQIGDVEAFTRGTVEVPLLADAPVPYQGFSFTVRYPTGDLEINRIGTEGTIIDALPADFVSTSIYPDEGLLVVGVLVEATPPFDFQLIPTTGFPLKVAKAFGEVLRSTPGDITLTFASSNESHVAPNIFTVDNLSRPAKQLISGTVHVVEPPLVPAFIRGDVNLDAHVDISDAIAIIDWRFSGASPPPCDDAADANTDDGLDLTDGIFILLFLFLGGDRPLPPQGSPGPDPFRGDLQCAHPLLWMQPQG